MSSVKSSYILANDCCFATSRLKTMSVIFDITPLILTGLSLQVKLLKKFIASLRLKLLHHQKMKYKDYRHIVAFKPNGGIL